MGKTLTGMLLTALVLSVNPAWAEPQFDGQLALEHIVSQVSFGPREPNNPRAKQKTVSFIKQTLQPLADRMTVCLALISGPALMLSQRAALNA